MERRYFRKTRLSKPSENFYPHLVPGLKIVHIGEDVWRVGKARKKGKPHQVIYGPNNKEYHLWDKDVEWVNNHFDSEYGTDEESVVNRHGNRANENRVKIYILTSILDSKENWCFDLKYKPESGETVKIIYNNGTVKNIKFSGEFESVRTIKYPKTITPVAYRIKNIIMSNTKKIAIPVAQLELVDGGNTIWIHSPQGATILRIKCTGKITVDKCKNSPTSHADAIVTGNINFCISEDAE